MTEPAQNRGFPFATALATLAALFLFLVLVLYVYRSPNPLGEGKSAETADPAAKLDDVRARNRAVLDGHDPSVKMSVDQAASALIEQAAKSTDGKNPHGRLPLPAEAKKP